MKRYLTLGLMTLVGMTCSIQQSFAKQVVVEMCGETYLFDVDAQDTFANVIGSINECFQNQNAHPENSNRIVQLISTMDPVTLQMIKKPRSTLRSYPAGLSASDSADIGYIVKTLSNSSLPKIKTAESSLKKAGDRIDPVHPLQFLICVFTNEELKVAVRNLVGRAWVWKDFLSGITETLAEENGKNNVGLYLNDFAATIKVDPNIVLSLAQAGRWEKFVTTLIEIVPRDGGSDRYNQ